MPANPIRLLLIDDDRAQFRLVAEIVKGFRSGQFTMEWGPNYDEGLVKLMSGAFEVCLLDYSLGDRDGLALLREARGRGNLTPIVFLTATADPAIDQAALDAGAQDYLVKGEVTPAMLERSLRYTLRLAESMSTLRELATRDQLTGALNRREFARLLQEEWYRRAHHGPPLTLVLLDVDHFKVINDRLGHKAGDEVLRSIAGLLRSNIRGVDWAFRFGGDEFACLLPDSDEAAGMICAQRLLESLAANPLTVGDANEGVKVTVSAGVATVDPAMASADALLKAADLALYAAKDAGRNQVFAWSKLPR